MQQPINPAVQDVVEQLMGGAGGRPAAAGLDNARFGFAAMEWAARGACNCTACKLLRRAHVTMVDDIIREVEGPDAGPDPQQG